MCRLWLIIIFTCACWPGPCFATKAPLRELRLALIVGNNTGLASERSLRYAEDEAGKVARTLMQIGQVQIHHTTLLQGKSPQRFWRRLQGLSQMARQMEGKARVTIFFYYSGHGSRGFLHMAGKKVSVKRIKSILHKSKARTVIAFFDACHSGTIVRRKGLQRRPQFKIHVDKKRIVRGRVYISSSGEFEASLESDDVQGSYFTHFLLSGLRGQADRNKDGKIDVDEIYQYTYQKTVARTAMTKRGTQHPSFEFGLRGTGQLILTWPKKAKSGLLFGSASHGTYIILSRHQQELMAEVVKRKGERTFVALPPQSYVVRKRAKGGFYVVEVNLLWGGKRTFDPSKFKFMKYRPSSGKGAAYIGPPNQWGLAADLRSGVVLGNAVLWGLHTYYSHRFTRHFVLRLGVGFHSGSLVSQEQLIPTHGIGGDVGLLFHYAWGRFSFLIGGLVGGGGVWQVLRQEEVRASFVVRGGAMTSLRWLFAQPFALHLQVQGGLELTNVGGILTPRPFVGASFGPAIWW